jgi:hypothetical protein
LAHCVDIGTSAFPPLLGCKLTSVGAPAALSYGYSFVPGTREIRSSDFFIRAKLALESAFRSRDDLEALLNDPAPTRAPVKPTLVEAILGRFCEFGPRRNSVR